MAIPRYDYGATLDPWYRRKAITGLAPDPKFQYAQLSALNEDTRAREQMGARLGMEQQRIDLAKDELGFSKRQANISNLFGGFAFGKNMMDAYKYGKGTLAPSPGQPLAPGIDLAKPGALVGPSTAPTYSLGGPAPPPSGTMLYPGSSVPVGLTGMPPPLSEGLDPGLVGAGGGGTPPSVAAGGGGQTLTPPLQPGSAPQTMGQTTPGMFSYGADSLAGGAASSSGALAGAGVTAGAGVIGDIGGRALGNWIAGKTGMDPKTTSDVMGAVGVFAAVTAATGNPVLGLAAGAVDAIFSMF